MIDPSRLRAYIVVEKWKFLECFTSVPGDSQPFRYIDNPELIDTIKNVTDPAATVLWFAILWLKYKGLIPGVREQLETITKIAQGRRRMDVDTSVGDGWRVEEG